MRKREQRLERIRAVHREYHTALIALGILARQLQQDPSSLARHGLKPTDFRNLQDHLAATYSVRAFAEFESGLRDVWRRTARDTHPKTVDLVDSLAGRRQVPGTTLREVHEVREYRNAAVHEDADEADIVELDELVRRLLQYFSFMPGDW
jgi:hypothetical protein